MAIPKIKSLTNYNNFKAFLRSDGENLSLTIDSVDALVLEEWIKNFPDGKCRLLIAISPTESNHPLSRTEAVSETFLVESIDTTTGIVVPSESLNNEVWYQVVSGAYIGVNLYWDGNSEAFGGNQDSIGSNISYFKDHSDSFVGRQSLRLSSSSGEDFVRRNIKVTEFENYYISYAGKVDAVSHGQKLIISGNEDAADYEQVGVTYDDFDFNYGGDIERFDFSNSTDWEKRETTFTTVEDAISVHFDLLVSGTNNVANFDNITVIQISGTNPAFEGSLGNNFVDVGTVDSGISTIFPKTGISHLILSGSDSSNYSHIDEVVVGGQWYTVNADVQAVVGTATMKLFQAVGNDPITTTTSGTGGYEHQSYTFLAVSGTLETRFYSNSTSNDVYVDNFYIMPVQELSMSGTSVPTPLADSYVLGRWLNDEKAIMIDGADEYTLQISGTDIDTAKGTFSMWYRPDYDFDDATYDRYLISGSDYARMYYDSSEDKFRADIWDGSNWDNISVSSVVQSFTSGTWIHMAMTYKNDDNISIYVDKVGVDLNKTWIDIGSWTSDVDKLRSSLKAFWNLNESEGSRSDSVGTNHLTDNATVTSDTGIVRAAAQFTEANSEYLSIADNDSISTGDIDFTYSCWIYFDSLGGNRTILGKDEASKRETTLWYSNALSRIKFQIFDGSNIIGNVEADNLGSPSTGRWYFIVAWHDSVANTINIQVDNGSINSEDTTGVPVDGTAPFEIGARSDVSVFMDGRIDAVGFWKKILTSGERTELYNSGNGKEYPFSIPYLSIGNISGSMINSANGALDDIRGYKRRLSTGEISQLYGGNFGTR